MPENISNTIQQSFAEIADSTMKAPKAHLSKLAELGGQSLDTLLKHITDFVLETAGKIILALVIFYVGRWLIRRLKKLLARVMERRKVDPSLQSFLLSLSSGALIAVLILIIVGILGINTTSLVAIFGAAGLGVGMAMSGTLQNFAGGVMILILKPYKLGDFVEAQGQSGTVKDIRLFNTVVNTPDNKTIFIPNGAISTGIINNYSAEKNRRVEWSVGISYGDDMDHTKSVVMDILSADKRILHDREKLVAIRELNTNAVVLVIRAWVPAKEFWPVFFAVNEALYKLLPENGIAFPFNQVNVTLNEVAQVK